MDPDERPTAKEVGDAFAEQYYLVLQKYSDRLHKFYKDDSNISRPGLDGIMRHFTLSSIDENDLNMLSSGGFDSVEITSVTSQDSEDDGVFVVVDGYFTSNERRRPRKFSQLFFLAPQENGGYFASNDLFRLIDISEAPAINVIETDEVADDGVKDVSKISDASVLQFGQFQHATSPDHSPEIKTDAVDDDTGNNQESQSSLECSVFVKRLPPYVTKDMIENAFKKFGRVKREGVVLRHPGLDYYYAFVDYEKADAAKRAIKASPVWVGSRKVQVKKRLDTIKSLREMMKIEEQEGRQYNQNRYGSEQVREPDVFNFWEWKKSIDEQMIREEARKLQEQEEEEKSRN